MTKRIRPVVSHGLQLASGIAVTEVHAVQPEETMRLHRDVRVVPIKNKGNGLGVKTNRALKRGTYVGSLVGSVYKRREWQRLVDAGAITGSYGMDLSRGYVVDVEQPTLVSQDAVIPRELDRAVAHRINEPSPGEETSAVWVTNSAVGDKAKRIDVYLDRDLGKNKEVLIHYGENYHMDMQPGQPGYYPPPSEAQRGPFVLGRNRDPSDTSFLD